jgi:hypothetical protein
MSTRRAGWTRQIEIVGRTAENLENVVIGKYCAARVAWAWTVLVGTSFPPSAFTTLIGTQLSLSTRFAFGFRGDGLNADDVALRARRGIS